MKRCLVIRHVDYEGVAGYRAPIEAAGYRIERVAAYDADFAGVDFLTPDLVVVMGGPMGVYETDRYPWIAPEIASIGARIAADRPILGVCLGSQMIAAALGAGVYPGDGPEIGFSPIALTPAGQRSPLARIGQVAMLHWHGDTFDLPEGCEHLAFTARYRHQAFRRGANLLGLQFHGEMGLDPRFETWLDHLDDDAMRAQVSADHDRLGAKAVAAGQAMLIEWLSGLGR